MARMHRLEFGRVAVLPVNKSPRMRNEGGQLDHFLTFITSPHVVRIGTGRLVHKGGVQMLGKTLMCAIA